MGRLDGKVTIVTGGARGIGRAIVEKSAREGARVTFLDLDAPTASQTARELQADGLAVDFIAADVTIEV